MAATQRLFVALWPDQLVRRQIAVVQKQVMTSTGLMDGVVAHENLHMTLQFLGEVAVSQIDSIEARLACVTAYPFQLTLDRWGQFTRPGILWVGADEPPAQLIDLQSDVASTLSQHNSTGKDKPYRPHVTLFRKVNQLPQVTAFEPIEWLVDRIVLVVSDTNPGGVKYRLLQEYFFGR